MDAYTVTVLSPGAKPRAMENGSHGRSSGCSAKQNEYLPGWPSVARSRKPGRVFITFIIVSRTARPIVALGRWPWPKALLPALIPSRCATGPLTMSTIAEPPVLLAGP